MSASRPHLVPATLHRVRCFLNTEGRLKVKPWAPASEVLDAFHDALRTRRGETDFWNTLEQLLQALIADMRQRRARGGPHPFDGEVLEPSRQAAVMAEIRAALSRRRRGAGRFRRLARSLSASAAASLLVLGGAATLGCYSSSGQVGDEDTAEATDVAGDAAPDARPDVGPDASPDATPDAEADADVADEATPEAEAEAACDPGTATIEEILTTCLPDPPYPTYHADVIACVDSLHASWRTGLTQLLACEDCDSAMYDLMTCFLNPGDSCRDPASAGEFDLDRFLGSCMVVLYIGVRFG